MFFKDNEYTKALSDYIALGFEEEITEDNFVIPAEADYVDFGEETEDWDIAQAKPGLWENIRRKKEREGKNYKPAKTEKEGRPSQEELKKAQSDKPSKNDPRRTPCLLYTSPSPRDRQKSRMPSSA